MNQISSVNNCDLTTLLCIAACINNFLSAELSPANLLVNQSIEHQ